MRLALCILFALLSATGTVATDTKTSTLEETARRFTEYNQDFLDFIKSTAPGSPEYQVANDLNTAAQEAYEAINASATLLEIHSAISCKEDRERIQPLIAPELNRYSKYLGILIEAANNGIAGTKRPGVAAEATKMRDDLRKSKRILDSIEF